MNCVRRKRQIRMFICVGCMVDNHRLGHSRIYARGDCANTLRGERGRGSRKPITSVMGGCHRRLLPTLKLPIIFTVILSLLALSGLSSQSNAPTDITMTVTSTVLATATQTTTSTTAVPEFPATSIIPLTFIIAATLILIKKKRYR
jgi:hypothetical protein